ncbi:MAG: hypothetical protein IPM14_06320 [bacterium]|nr:hypothetical protein [bacterium]
MKALIVALVVIFFAFFFGCHENSLTNPITDDSGMQHSTPMQNTLDKDALSFYTGVIKLEGILLDPIHRLNSYFQISGVVQYRIDDVNLDTVPPYTGIKVSLFVNAELKGDYPGNNALWIVRQAAEVVVPNNSSSQFLRYIEKEFEVHNTCGGKLNLLLTLELCDQYLSFESMRLVKVDNTILPVGDPISQ